MACDQDGSTLALDIRGQYTPGVMLLFGLFFTVTMLTFGYTFTTLSEQTDSGRVQAAVVGMESFDGDVQDVIDGAPARVTEMEFTDTSLLYGDEVTVSVTARGGGVNVNWATTTKPVVAEIDETGRQGSSSTSIIYAGGLIARWDAHGSGSVLVDSPGVQTNRDRLVVSVPSITPKPDTSTNFGVSGSQTVPVRILRDGGTVLKRSATASGGDATTMTGHITIDQRGASRTLTAWTSYFEESSAFTARDLDGDGDTEYLADVDGDGEDEVRAFFETETLVLRETALQVAFNSGG